MSNMIELRTTARKLFGYDIDISLARHPNYGDDDVCFLVYGARHAEAATVFASHKGRVCISQAESLPSASRKYTYSVVEMSAL
jgi:hypothetical protein